MNILLILNNEKYFPKTVTNKGLIMVCLQNFQELLSLETFL